MKKVILILIFILALFLRVYKLGSYPVGFLWDEAGLGYNAYSVLKTGHDEYGKLLPLIFKSFGDYKPGLYVYFVIPSVIVFGLNEFAVRMPSAIAGSLTVILLYLLLTEARFTQIGKRISADSVPIVAALFLALSPWHINFSRGAWELNLMLTEIVFALFLLVRFLNSRHKWQLYLGALTMLSTLLTYQTAKLLMPTLLIAFVFFFRQQIISVSRKEKISFLTLVILGWLIFNLITVAFGKAGRLKVMSVFSYPRSEEETNMILDQDNNSRLDFAVFHSAPVFFTRSVLGRFFNHFSGKFLFFTGDWSNARNGVVYQGVMYYLDTLFLIIGLAVIFGRAREPLVNFMLFWLLIAPLSSALTRDSVSSVRSFSMVIPLVFLTTTGVNSLCVFLSKKGKIIRNSCYLLLAIGYLLLFIRFLDLYFLHDPKFSSKDRLYGYKEMIDYIRPLIANKNKVIITNKYGQPYIFYLFYTKYDPAEYQRVAWLRENPYGDVGEVEKLNNLEFRKIYFPEDRGIPNSLFVGDEFDLPMQDIIGQERITFLKEIQFLNGKTAFRIVETK